MTSRPREGNQIAEGAGLDTKLDRDGGRDIEGHGSSARATNHVPECSTHAAAPLPPSPQSKPEIY